MVQLTEEIDWSGLIELVQSIRMSKLESESGRPPHLRALTGAATWPAERLRIRIGRRR